MHLYMQIGSLLYLLVIAVIYFRKKSISTIENTTFKAMIVYAMLNLIFDIICTHYNVGLGGGRHADLIFKLYLYALVSFIFTFTFYVYEISSKYHIDNIPFKEHPNRKKILQAFLCYVILIIIICVIMTFLRVDFTIEDGYYLQSGPGMVCAYIVAIIGVISWIIFIIGDRKNFTNKKYIPVYFFDTIGLATIALQLLFPQLPLVSTVVGAVTVITFFTMENPDARLITKLNEARDIAEDANKAKTDFLSSMSHEIRTPLNAIVGFGQALAKEDISGTAKEEVKDILMASNTLLDIVNGILDISKIESNKIEIVETEYNTKKMISEITSLTNARIGSKPIDFKVLVDQNLPAVLYGDSMRVKQVVINLLTNAVKYTTEGRVLFQVKAENNLEKNISKVIFSVQDTGMGMTEEDVAHLFNKYQRFDMEKNVDVEGTGLGMAITKSLVELMKGDIQVKSKYGEGSTFTIILEQKIIKLEEDKVEEEKVSDTLSFNASGSRVLVVDDNKINLKVAQRLLKEYNITVETANSGSESIDYILDGKKYDLIFMDIMMPKMNGMETLENLKNIIGFDMPVVALTADVISGMEEKYISKGFDDCLAKPIVEEELYYMLKKFLKEVKDETSSIPVVESTPVVETPAPVTAPIEIPKTVEEPTLVEMPAPTQVVEAVPAPVAEPTPVLETPTVVESSPDDVHNVELLKNNKIDVDAGLELLKDMEMYDMTLEEFFNELQNKIKDLTEFKEAGNMDDYAILAHALKTEARYVGCNELGDMAYEHELAGKASDQAKVNEKFDELKNESNRVYEIIKRYLGV